MVALVIGATGMVGSQLIQQLLADDRFEKIRVFSRRSLAITHPKLEEHLIDFNFPEQWRGLVRGNVLFSALGTTLSKAGSKGAQFKIDYKYQYLFSHQPVPLFYRLVAYRVLVLLCFGKKVFLRLFLKSLSFWNKRSLSLVMHRRRRPTRIVALRFQKQL